MFAATWHRSRRTRFGSRTAAIFVVVAGMVSMIWGPFGSQAETARAAETNGKNLWQLDRQRSLLYVKVFNDKGKLGSGFAHDHVIRAGAWNGWLSYEPSDPRRCRLLLEVPVQKLVVDEAWLRQTVGFKKPLDDKDRADVRRSMLGEDQLDAARHSIIRIEGNGCTRVEGESDRIALELAVTVRGRKKKLSTTVRVVERSGELQMQGGFRVRHSDFGIKPYSAFLGAVANAEPIDFVARVVARR